MTTTVLDRPLVGTADPWQQVLRHRGPLLRVLGGPGTGKSRLAIDVVVDRVERGELRADRCLVLAPSRLAAARMRDAVTARLGTTTREPLARTVASLGFGILRRLAIRDDLPTPVLLSGPEQDVVLRDLLAGHRLEPGSGPTWPHELADALVTNGFRAELRDLLMRAVEHGLDGAALAELGREVGRPEWIAAGAVLEEYDQVTALSRPGAYDPAWIVTAAADALTDDPDLIEEVAALIGLIVVDDAQELTTPSARLLDVLARAGIDVLLVGDPDAAVQTFRGADPAFLGRQWRSLPGGAEAPTVRLTQGFRLPETIAGAAARVVDLVGTSAGARHRGAPPAQPGGAVEAHVFRSAAAEAGFVADCFRRAHLLDGIPWSQLAVVVRGQARAATIRRVLAAARVPVAEAASVVALRDAEAVRPLLTLLQIALAAVPDELSRGSKQFTRAAEKAAGEQEEGVDVSALLTPEAAVDLLTSPYGGCDAVTLRRLRRGLRRDALAAGDAAPADNLLARAIVAPGRLLPFGSEADGARRIAAMLRAATSLLRRRPTAGAADVLWALWSSAKVADSWRDAALAGGRAGARADRDLDAVLELFAAAETLAERLPGSSAAAVVTHVTAQELAADSVTVRSSTSECVSVLTPHAAAGREWRHVAVVGLQEGAWPDLRLRGSLLGSEHLVDLLAGRERSVHAAQTAIRHDEARLLHVAVTRSRERLIVTAVQSDDEQPSAYLDVVEPRLSGDARPFTEVERPLTLVGAVGALRREVVHSPTSGTSAGTGAPSRAARALAVLADHGVRGADPETWWALRSLTTAAPRVPGDTPVAVSPSGLVEFGKCQLRWLLTRVGGDGPSVGAAAIGTLVHEVIADADAPVDDSVIGQETGGEPVDRGRLSEALDARWARLGLDGGWRERAKRADAEAMLDRAVAYFSAASQDGWVRVGAEVSLRHTLGRAEIRGVVDRVEAGADGRLRIIDFKTGSSKPRLDEVARHAQLGCYQVVVAGGAFGDGLESAGAALVQLGKAGTGQIARSVQAQPPLAADDDPQWAERLIIESADVMAGAQFQARVGDSCRTCPVRTSCPVAPEGVVLQ
ncbi:MAG: ATP-dependent helicase [Tetrasphaera jenkinsii]|jgi:superfamily I DNA/RNA helicase/RecB family exonuclease|nr:ATP-dependent helicase [Tetrasphaera jenkinsii]